MNNKLDGILVYVAYIANFSIPLARLLLTAQSPPTVIKMSKKKKKIIIIIKKKRKQNIIKLGGEMKITKGFCVPL